MEAFPLARFFFDLIDPIIWRRKERCDLLEMPPEVRVVIYDFMPYQARVFLGLTCHLLREELGIVPLPEAFATASVCTYLGNSNPLIREMVHRVLLQGPWWLDQIPLVRGFMFGTTSTLELKCQFDFPEGEGGSQPLHLRFSMTLERLGLSFSIRDYRREHRTYDYLPRHHRGLVLVPVQERFPPPHPHDHYMKWSTGDGLTQAWSWEDMKQQLAFIPWDKVDEYHPRISPLTREVEEKYDTRVPIGTFLENIPGLRAEDIMEQIQIIGRAVPGQDMDVHIPRYSR
jgi:hypothetical protein